MGINMRKSIKKLLALSLGIMIFISQTNLTVLPLHASKNTDAQEGANSFRYKDGKLIAQPADMLRGASTNAWKKVDGVYLNSKGTEIENAYCRGIDVSHHQGDINWASVKKDDIDFAIIRCGYIKSKKMTDRKWYQNADACTAQGIPFGTYIYSYANTTAKAKEEAKHVLNLIKGYRLRYPIYFDMEDAAQANLSKSKLKAIAEAFCSTIEKAGYEAAIYANYSWFSTKLTDKYFNSKDRWVARYNYYCGLDKPYNIWQCSSTAKVKGIDGNVDLNFQIGSKPLAQVKKIKLNAASSVLYIGDIKKLSASVSPQNAYNKSVSFTTSNSKVAAVSNDGTVKAIGCGKAVITAKAKDKCGAKAVFNVEVRGLRIDEQQKVIERGQTLKLKAGHYATRKPVSGTKWQSSNEKVAIVKEDGTVKAVGYGNAKITAKAGSLYGVYNTTVRTPVSSVKLNKKDIVLTTGRSAAVKATVLPATATYKTVTYSSSSPSVAKVSSSGNIQAVSPGRAVITARAEKKKTTSIVYVAPPKTTSFKYSQTGRSKIRLNWKTVKGTSGYEISRYDTKTKKYIRIHTSKASTSSYSFSRQNGSKGAVFKVGDNITYRLTPYKSIGGKRYYGPASALKTKILPLSTKVTGVKRVSSTKARITWKKTSGVTGYIVYYSASRSGGYRKAATLSARSSAYTKAGLKKKRTYYFKVRTYQKVGKKTYYGPMSNVRSIKL